MDQSSDDFNIRQDLLSFYYYVKDRYVKRSYRENRIPQVDLKRLSTILQVPKVLKNFEEETGCWSEFICDLAYHLKIVSYIRHKESSWYVDKITDNFIRLQPIAWKNYLQNLSGDKEKMILDVLMKNSVNEFYHKSSLGISPRFPTRGRDYCGSNDMDLFSIRVQLLKLLSSYEENKEIPFSDFVERVKREYPHLILKKGKHKQKYEYFYEYVTSKDLPYPKEKEIQETDSDAFERVEGRYLAFFLEDIPALMQFVRLKYDQKVVEDRLSPSPIHYIKSFTVLPKLKGVLTNQSEFHRVSVTITADFKIFLDAPLFPDRERELLEPYCKVHSYDKHVLTLELNRKKSVESLARETTIETPIDVIKKLTKNIPQNVMIEMQEWCNQADQLIVYEDFGLLELRDFPEIYKEKLLEQMKDNISEQIVPGLFLVRAPKNSYEYMKLKEWAPEKIEHSMKRLLLEWTPFRFIRETKVLEKVRLAEVPFFAIQSPHVGILKKLDKFLQEEGVKPTFFCKETNSVIFPETGRVKIRSFIKKISTEFECVGELST